MKNLRLNKNKQTKTSSFDYLIIVIFILSMIIPIIIAFSQQYIVQYGDDITSIYWAKTHSVTDIFTSKIGTGYRPMQNLIYLIGYNLWGSESKYYYLFSGILFSGGMVFLYLLGKTLRSKIAGISAVLLYLFLDSSFILVSKINFIVTTGEVFFIISALYFAIKYIDTKDIYSKYLAIILSIFAFLTKEPSLLIIPSVVLVYLYFKKQLNKKYIILCLIVFIYMIIIVLFLAPNVGSGDANLIQRIINNIQFYFNIEIYSQFKSPILIVISLLLASYYISYHNLKREIMLCLIWFVVGILPFLITQQPVQPTYIAEANIGMVLLIGIVISEGFKKINIFSIILVIGIVFQIVLVPMQITNMQNYNRAISDNQNTFFETVESMKQLPPKEIIFYFSDDVRQKYNGMQLVPDFFRQYLCIRDLCEIKVVTDYTKANYVILPSSLDIYIFQKEFPNEKSQIIMQAQHGKEYGLILRK